MKYGYTEQVRYHLNLNSIGGDLSTLARFIKNNDPRIVSCYGIRDVVIGTEDQIVYNYKFTYNYHLPTDDVTLGNYSSNPVWRSIHDKRWEVISQYEWESGEGKRHTIAMDRNPSIDEEDTPSELEYTLDYNDSACKYRFDKLENVVYLISADSGNIVIDNGAAFINELNEAPLTLKTYNMSLEESDELDERYRFTHTLQFSVNGYANYTDFQDKYYVILKDKNGTYWLMNPMFPCKVTYTYTLDSRSSHTDFTLSTISNHPMLMVYNVEESTPYVCDYTVNSFEKLLLNVRDYSIKDGNNNVIYTNDGFKEIVFNKGTQIFTETYDGNNIRHSITFNINFNDYKSSWHYNILEFTENRYSAVIRDKDDKFITCGFGFGLKPSYTVYGNGGEEFNRIEIVLQDVHDVGGFATITDSGRITESSGFTYEYTKEYNGFECVGQNRGIYLLQQEVDAFGNVTGRFKCLEGYEHFFQDLNLIGTFSERTEFITSDCDSDHCGCNTALPSTVVFTSPECREYSLEAKNIWSITSSDEGVTVSPSYGQKGQYTITLCNTYEMSDVDRTVNLNLRTCGENTQYSVIIGNGYCLPQGNSYSVNANAQTIRIPTTCCARNVADTDDWVRNATVTDGLITLSVLENESATEDRLARVTITYCDGTTRVITVTQSKRYEQWVASGYVCEDGNKYQQFRLYTGTTADNITTPTSITKQGGVIEYESDDCLMRTTRTVFNGNYYCVNGVKMKVMEEEESYDNGVTWRKTGVTSLGESVEDTDDFCSQEVSYDWRLSNESVCEGEIGTYRWVTYEGETMCDDRCQLFSVQKKQISLDGGVTWEDTLPLETRMSTRLKEFSESCSCEALRRWTVIDNDYVCSGTTKFSREKLEYSSDNGVTWKNSEPLVTRIGNTVIEENSIVCGSIPEGLKLLYNATNGNTYTVDCDDDYVLNRELYTPIISAEHFAPSTYVNEIAIGNCIRIINGAFYANFGILVHKGIYIPNSVDKIISHSFYATRAPVVKIPDSVVYIGDNAFLENIGIQIIDLPNNLKRIPNSFAESTNLTSVTIPDSVEYIGNYAFGSCYNLTSITIPSNVKHIGDYAFSGCFNLTSVTISEGVEYIGDYAFRSCSRLTSITIPSSVKHIGDYAFDGCSNLTSVTIPDSVEYIGGSLSSNSMFPTHRYNYVIYIGKTAMKLDSSTVKDLSLLNDTKAIAVYAFRGCTNLTSVTIPDSVEYIAASAFRGCTNLTSVTIPSNVKHIGDYAFDGCSNLTSVTIPDSVEYIGDEAFRGCTNLTSITIPSSVKHVGDKAFRSCSSLTSVVLVENGSHSIISHLEGTPWYSNEGVEEGNGDDGYTLCVHNVFIRQSPRCSGIGCIRSLNIKNSIDTIGDNAFVNQTYRLTDVTIPSNVKHIGDKAFRGCSSLTSVTISEGVEYIGDYAFDGCSSLTSITIPSSVKHIGKGAFAVNGLTVKILATTPIKLDYDPFSYSSAYGDSYVSTVCVPFESFNKYYYEPLWGNYVLYDSYNTWKDES